MTRRVLKDQPSPRDPIGGASPYEQDWVWLHGMDGSIFRQMLPAPPYALGDRLWMREAFATDGSVVRYYATDDVHELRKKRSPIHMPRWASRLTLLVTDVRVQRLQEISRGDAMEEGCPFANMADGPNPRDWYRDIWNSIHGPDAWDANPWVAAISFETHRCNIDTMEEGTW